MPELFQPTNEVAVNENNLKNKVPIIQGMKLIKTQSEWMTANDFFKLHLPHNETINNFDTCVQDLNKVLYSY